MSNDFSDSSWQYAIVMSSLYRAYRPQIFDEVLGQEHIRSSLVTSLKKNLVGHAYLFSGPRGTGKTTLARLFARALNCPSRSTTQNPCNKCQLCLEIGEGKSVDVLEIDAASNRGIDEIRELRDRVAFAPSRTKFKVYIIDEVHMLTKEAFNALLKTLEEPPSHVIFILATTELHKVPETIISRCQRYQFHRASAEALVQLLQNVAKKEKLTIEPPALQAIAERAEGSYRDALTLLGNISSHDGDLNAETVRGLLGLPPQSLVDQALNLIVAGDAEQLIVLLKEFIDQGGDSIVLTKAIADVCKNEILSLAKRAGREHLSTILEQLLLTLARARTSADPTALVIAQLIGLGFKYQQPFPRAVNSPAMRDVQKVEKPKSDELTVAVDAVAPNPPPLVAAATDIAGGFWSQFLEGIKAHNHALYMVVRSARLEGLTDHTVIVAVKFRFYVDRLQELRNRKIIEAVAAEVAGRALKLECVIRPDLDVEGTKNDDLVRAVVDVFELEEVK